MTPYSSSGLPFPEWPPTLSWPFPSPVPIELASGGPLGLEQRDLDIIKIASLQLEQAFVRFRQSVGSINVYNSRYGLGVRVAQVGIVAEAAFHEARRNAFARGFWP